MEQEIELLGHKGKIGHVKGVVADNVWRKEDKIRVWIKFAEAVDSTFSFAKIEIPARDYSKEEFLQIVTIVGEKQLALILENHRKEKAKIQSEQDRQVKLDAIVNKLNQTLAG